MYRHRQLRALRCLLAVLMLLAAPAVARAQGLASLPPGARVRIDLPATGRARLGRERAQSVVGTLAGVQADTLLLTVRAGVAPLRVPVASLRGASVSRGRPPRWQAALRGAVVPALVGAALSAVTTSIRRREGDPSPARMAASSAAWGAASGAALGAWSPRERWHRLATPTPLAPATVASRAGNRPTSDRTRVP